MKRVNNHTWAVSLIIFVFFTLFFAMTVYASLDESLLTAACGIVITGIMEAVAVYLVIGTPRYYVFDYEGITLRYVFGFYKHYAWKSVTKITKMYRHYGRHSSAVYVINGNSDGKTAFFANDKTINATAKTEESLAKFWKGKINTEL